MTQATVPEMTAAAAAHIGGAVSLVPSEKLAFCAVVQSGSRALHNVDPAEVDLQTWAADPDTLVVPPRRRGPVPAPLIQQCR